MARSLSFPDANGVLVVNRLPKRRFTRASRATPEPGSWHSCRRSSTCFEAVFIQWDAGGYLLTINGYLTVAVSVARSVADGVIVIAKRRSEVRKLKYKKPDLILVIRMAPGNSELLDYFLVPAGKLLLTKDGKKLRISDRTFGQSRLGSLGAVLRTLHDTLRTQALQPTTS